MKLKPQTLRALHAEWRKLSPGIEVRSQESGASITNEREARLAYANSKFENRKAKIESWNDLTEGEAKRLLKIMREESGDGSAYRSNLIASLAVELWGSNWDAELGERIGSRFRVAYPSDLGPREAHEMIEELLSRIARRDGIGIEEARDRFARRHGRR